MQAEVFTKDHCPYCTKAKHLLERRGVTYIEIDAVTNRDELFERVIASTGDSPKTVPQIYLNGEYVGGYDQLVAHYACTDAPEDNCA